MGGNSNQAGESPSRRSPRDNEATLTPKTPSQQSTGTTKVYTLEEVAKHSSEDDMWLAINDKVYNVTSFWKKHPGGVVISTWGGRDASDVYRAWHTSANDKYLKAYCIGDVDPSYLEKLSPKEKEWRHDKQEMFKLSETMHSSSFSFFATKFITCLLLMALSLGLAAFPPSAIEDSWFFRTLISALALGLCWHQFAWLGHDLMHNAVFPTIEQNHWAGMVAGNLLTGLSCGWWKYTHNMHHAVTNEYERDPDVTHLPFLAVTERMFNTAKANGWLIAYTVPYQHILYLGYMAMGRINLYIQGIYLFTRNSVMAMPEQKLHYPTRLCVGERIALLGFYSWLGYVVYNHPHPIQWLIISHAYAAFLHVQITLSHWAMEFASVTEDEDWIKRQAQTSQNINNSWFMDWYMGGLNYQIEHHCFPMVPRHYFPVLQKHMQKFFKKWDIPYNTKSTSEAIMEVVRSLRTVACSFSESASNKKH